MRYAHSLDVMDTDGALEVHRSTIETSRKTIRMQIADLYSDKPGSIVREIAANAFDSHKRAGQTRPFYVHAPTTMVPEFFVRDYGTGMTKAVMETVYIVLGKSDKDQSDDEVGMWGLGSKSPFSYADMYTITCYDGVEARHYGYGIAEDGIPDLYLMAVNPCDEPAGVRIGLSVESKDFELFAEAVRFNAIAHEGGFEHNLGEVVRGEKDLVGAEWCAYTNSPLKALDYSNASWWARQGCVLYRIDSSQIMGLPREDRMGVNRAWIIDCPIGTIKMTPSREAIQYDEEVIDYLQSRITSLQEEVRESVWQAVKDVKDVSTFFKEIARIKPGFITADFTHPLTGLTSPMIPAANPVLFFESKRDTGGQWSFGMPEKISLGGPIAARYIILDDISPLLDPSRAAGEDAGHTRWLSRSEVRRVSRFTRAYLEKAGLSSAIFLMNIDWSDDFMEACFPKAPDFTRISFQALRDAVPRRIAPPPEKSMPPIRGLALAKAAGEQKPVYALEAAAEGIAWVSSDQYRRQSSALFKLCRLYKLNALYIAAAGDAQALVSQTFPHLSDAIEAEMGRQGMTLADWYYMRTTFRHSYHNTCFIEWLRGLLSKAPKDYTRLAQGQGPYSVMAKGLRKVLAGKRFDITEDDQKALEGLLIDVNGVKTAPPEPKWVSSVGTAHKSLESSYNNPTVKFVDGLPKGSNAEDLAIFVDAILYLQGAVAPTKKFN